MGEMESCPPLRLAGWGQRSGRAARSVRLGRSVGVDRGLVGGDLLEDLGLGCRTAEVGEAEDGQGQEQAALM
jgi:hypothetical protein